ncbi:PIG-P [Gaertneriomyces semiglobifer]|nr:PIG-P [Gaertneriomyces semiglobifer]
MNTEVRGKELEFPGAPRRNASEKREYYGFVVYLVSFVAFVTYLGWSLLPDEMLHALGVYYYPTRWWALAIPVHVTGWIPFILLMYNGINLWRTPPFESLNTITDEKAKVLSYPVSVEKFRKLADKDAVPEIEDIPISLMNEILFADTPA